MILISQRVNGEKCKYNTQLQNDIVLEGRLWSEKNLRYDTQNSFHLVPITLQFVW